MFRKKQLQIEYKRSKQNPLDHCYARPKHPNGDLSDWEAFILGPRGTPYEFGLFKVKITIPNDYPFKPPKI